MSRLPYCMLLLLFLAAPVAAADLRLELGHGAVTLTTRQLLSREDIRDVALPDDVAFKRAMRYRVAPLKALLKGIRPGDHLQFVAADGFAAEIPATLIWNAQGSEPWLAIEDPARPWPMLPDDRGRAGPFYLVWTHPQAAGIGPEQWPYQVVAIRKLADVATRFPAILPDPNVPEESPERRGLAVFQGACFSCHTLNGAGDSRLGPDLNIPYNPTEYLRADLLRAYVRDPQSLRLWPQAKMPGFGTQVLSDSELDDLLAYLRHMAGRKAPVGAR